MKGASTRERGPLGCTLGVGSKQGEEGPHSGAKGEVGTGAGIETRREMSLWRRHNLMCDVRA